METFFLVWEPNRGYTQKRHDTKSKAIKEAERLAHKEPGEEFFVLEALTMSTTEKPVKTIVLDDLPF